MVLNDREERALAEIERRLDDDAELGSRMRARSTPARWWPTAAAVLGAVVAVGLALLGEPADAMLLLVVAASPMLWRAWRHGERPAGRAGPIGARRHVDDTG